MTRHHSRAEGSSLLVEVTPRNIVLSRASLGRLLTVGRLATADPDASLLVAICLATLCSDLPVGRLYLAYGTKAAPFVEDELIGVLKEVLADVDVALKVVFTEQRVWTFERLVELERRERARILLARVRHVSDGSDVRG